MADELKAKTKDGHGMSDFLVVEDPEKESTWHLPVMKGGKPDARLMGAAHAALTVGYRGNKYEGMGKEAAMKKLKRLYKRMGMKWPEDKGKGEKKSLSLMELESRVYQAIREKLSDALDDGEDEWQTYCPIDVFMDFAIVKAPAGLYQIAYQIDAETYDINLGEPMKVKIEYIPDDTPAPVEDEAVDPAEEKYKEMLAKKAELLTVKSIGTDRIGAYAVLWGNGERKDLTGEWFDSNTEELTTIYDAVGRLPYLYHHALDGVMKTSVIGVVDTLKKDDIGLWYEAQLKLAADYDTYVRKLLDGKVLKTSSQTFPTAREVDETTGYIKRWPIVEITATPTPAEYRMQPVEFLKGAFQAVGCNDLACVLKSKLGMADEPTGDQGAEKARWLAVLEQERAELDLLAL